MLNNLKKQLENSYELLDVLNNIFLFIAKIDLENNKISILQNRTSVEYPYGDDKWQTS